MLGLPDGVTVCLFDLDGVLTDTASVHKAAWKQTFDAYLKTKGDPQEFTDEDYDEYVDGKPREDGVHDFLHSRNLEPSDAEAQQIGDRKNELVLKKIHTDGVRVFEGSRSYLQAAEKAGLRRIVVSSSANTRDVLRVTGLDQYVEGRVDGVTIKDRHLNGKPAPDSFLAGAVLAHATPQECAVFEDALAGVEAGRRGSFGAVIGVDRKGDDEHAAALRSHGATVVVRDLADLLPDQTPDRASTERATPEEEPA